MNESPIFSVVKPYFSFSNYVKEKFGVKVGKISIDTNFGCKHKENNKGCTFCNLSSYRGSYIDSSSEATTQWLQGVENYKNSRYQKYYAYFQLGTPLQKDVASHSIKAASEIIKYDDCVGLMFGARSDMTDSSTLEILNDLASKTDKEIWLEMGLQSIHKQTLDFINRGHDYDSFVEKINEISKNYKNIKISVHVIFGLPKASGEIETEEEMLATVRAMSLLPIHAVKYHHLQIVKNTNLALQYKKNPFNTLSEEYYISLMCKVISLTNKNIIIARLIGDSSSSTLIAPIWERRKTILLQSIEKDLKYFSITQGSAFYTN